ncbi:DUF3291 domain-containing protein [Aerophototrophica crusticola]|uniref:DUF3291 domain-containing protein n=1 Tax=Aerophototrophica crusticola TaxID=1709002 RepID=A0A858R8T1_9PROT|nr:DUF3291 domain-containing protein [Rhodospirillaceae bacterium B3]
MYHLAQVNIAKLLAPIDSPQLLGFTSRLDMVNAMAESAPGFVWRLKGDGNDATSLRPFPDPEVIVNMSVWESVEALFDFTYRQADHTGVMRGRREWFARHEGAYMALWWVPAGHEPTLAEARERLDHLDRHGPTPVAFTFKERFPAPVPA